MASKKSKDSVEYVNTPSVLFSSCYSEEDPRELIREITNNDQQEGKHLLDSIHSFRWDFETKYYTCTVNLCVSDERTIGNECFAESIECVVLQFSSNSVESWTKIQSWLPFLIQLNPSVKLLVCKSCEDSHVISRSKVQKWCIANEFELIEMSPAVESDDEDDYDSFGVKRIKQVLHAHTWPNLVMKDKPDTLSPYMKKLMEESKDCVETTSNPLKNSQKSSSYDQLGMDELEMLQAFHDESEDGLQSFETLFSRMQFMKEKADALPPEERKAFAGNVAMSFLSAMGLSDEEGSVGSD